MNKVEVMNWILKYGTTACAYSCFFFAFIALCGTIYSIRSYGKTKSKWDIFFTFIFFLIIALGLVLGLILLTLEKKGR